MNLVPIDTAGTPTELVGGEPSPGGGDFAALMAGLMTGDTQIVPLIDIPAGGQLPDGDAATSDDNGDVAAAILEFVGTPPAGLTITPMSDPEQPATGAEAQESIDTPTSAAPVLDWNLAGSEPGTTDDHVDGQALATVHPIRTQLTTSPSPTSAPVTATPDTSVTDLVTNGPHRAPSDEAAPVPTDADPKTAVAPTNQPAGPTATDAPGAPSPATAEASVPAATSATTSIPTAEATASVRQGSTEPVTPQAPTPERAGGDSNFTEPEVEVDAASVARPLETARPGSSITQPAMVGIARRVEEAIAALATKPDPKIVTLQLDELDGLRLTVALRPDGIHLSSSGDATLTTEIERALASRGFDLAAGGDRGRQASEDNADDGWRPQPAPPGRQARPNQPGIRL